MITLAFTEEQLRVIDFALGDQPYKLAAPIIHAINAQLAQQRQAEEVEEVAE